MAILTLTTDLGSTDYYVAALKGRILSSLPSANIIDISNDIPKFDHLKAAYLVRNAAKFYPKGTVHIIGVNNFKSNSNKLLIAIYLDQYFVSYDTGFFSLLVDDAESIKIYEVPTPKVYYNNLMPFDDLIDVAIKIAKNISILTFAAETKDIKTQYVWKPILHEKSIHGNVVFIDSFDNVVTNISQETLSNYLHFKTFEIQLHLRKNVIRYISKSYADVSPGELVALINYAGYLEIAMNQGQAARLLGFKIGEKINIDFSR